MSIKKLLFENSDSTIFPIVFKEKISANFSSSCLDLPLTEYFSLLNSKIYNIKIFVLEIILKITSKISPILLNIIHIYFKPKIFWEYVLQEKSGILIKSKNKIKRIQPIGSVICDIMTGSIITNIYYFNEILICPIYQGSLNSNKGLIFYDFEKSTFYLISTNRIIDFFKKDKEKFESFLKAILDSFSKLNIEKLSNIIYIGGKINFDIQ